MTKTVSKPRPRGGASHLCPRCNAVSRVKETRRFDRTVLRYRVCLECDHEYETHESAVCAARSKLVYRIRRE